MGICSTPAARMSPHCNSGPLELDSLAANSSALTPLACSQDPQKQLLHYKPPLLPSAFWLSCTLNLLPTFLSAAPGAQGSLVDAGMAHPSALLTPPPPPTLPSIPAPSLWRKPLSGLDLLLKDPSTWGLACKNSHCVLVSKTLLLLKAVTWHLSLWSTDSPHSTHGSRLPPWAELCQTLPFSLSSPSCFTQHLRSW